MNNLSGILMAVVFIGIGATLVMDVWLLALKRAGVPTLNFAMLGRWVGLSYDGNHITGLSGIAQDAATAHSIVSKRTESVTT